MTEITYADGITVTVKETCIEVCKLTDTLNIWADFITTKNKRIRLRVNQIIAIEEL